MLVPVKTVARHGIGVARGLMLDSEMQRHRRIASILAGTFEEVRQRLGAGSDVVMFIPIKAVARHNGGVALVLMLIEGGNSLSGSGDSDGVVGIPHAAYGPEAEVVAGISGKSHKSGGSAAFGSNRYGVVGSGGIITLNGGIENLYITVEFKSGVHHSPNVVAVDAEQCCCGGVANKGECQYAAGGEEIGGGGDGITGIADVGEGVLSLVLPANDMV